MSDESTITVRYPDAPVPGHRDGATTEYPVIDEFGRYALVYGLSPHNHTRSGRYHAYLVVNMVHNTIDFYSISEAQARATMLEMDTLWDAVDERMETMERLDEEKEADGDSSVAIPVPAGTKLQ